MTRKMIQAIRFFQHNSGYCTPPGRMACAKSLALAERAAELCEASYEWSPDECVSYDDLTDDPNQLEIWRKNPPEVWMVLLRDGNGAIRDSLGGIVNPDRKDRRIYEAELALAAFGKEFRL